MEARNALPSYSARWAILLWVAVHSYSYSAHADDGSDSNSSSDYLNVYGQPLQPCSQDGMALTGYIRSGYCVDRWNDQGSHHVCIDLSSLGGGSGDDDGNGNENGNDETSSSEPNFCAVTGQSDWCSNQEMPCHTDPDDSSCPIENWCVCQWAFSSYVKAATDGCDGIQTVVCESVNAEALAAYQTESAKWNADPKYRTALECLVQRCGLDASAFSSLDYSSSSTSSSSSSFNPFRSGGGGTMFVFVVAAAALAGMVGIVYHHRKRRQQTIRLNNDDDETDGVVKVLAPVRTGSHLLRDD